MAKDGGLKGTRTNRMGDVDELQFKEAGKLSLSFIIPARNEAEFIGRTIDSINSFVQPDQFTKEILVVDHGSSDGTQEIADAAGAKVLNAPEARSISELRNLGTNQSRGLVLVFIDADVTLTQEWSHHISEVHERIQKHPRIITGSEVVAPPDSSLLERVWFSMTGTDRSHVNSGHLIVARSFFDELGGFDVGLKTAEDFDLCQRAIAIGGRIEQAAELLAHHHGYPKTIRQFFQRELWHGLGVARSMHEMCSSKVGLATLVIFLSVPVSIVGAIWSEWALLIPVFALLGCSTLAAVLRPKRQLRDFPAVASLYVVYFLARVSAVFARLFGVSNLYWKALSRKREN